MRPTMFVLCFTLGVALMIYSGYVPRSASAVDTPTDTITTGPNPDVLHRLYRARPNPLDDYQPPPPTPAEWSDEALYAADTDNFEDLEAEPNAAHATEPVPNTSSASAAEAATRLNAIAAALDAPAETEIESPAELPPIKAEAGEGRVVWMGWNELKLDGSGSQGEGLEYDWIQTRGSVDLIIVNPHDATTTVKGFDLDKDLSWTDEIYAFELLAIDEHGQEDYDTVEFVVRSAPQITLTPAPRRRFEARDGYPLAHYESWITNLETFESTFQIVSHSELTFTRVSGRDYEITGGPMEGLYVYKVTLYGQPDVAISFVELLVDTAERIPCIMQLGVSWVEVEASQPPATRSEERPS